MAPSSKSEKDDGKQKAQRKHKDHVVKLLVRGKVGFKTNKAWRETLKEWLRNGASVKASAVAAAAKLAASSSQRANV